jgi:hypothetical protein
LFMDCEQHDPRTNASAIEASETSGMDASIFSAATCPISTGT